MALFAAVLACRERKTWRALIPIALKVAAIAVISGLIAATVWLPYLVDFLRGAPSTSGTALHYLPEAGATLPFPMFEFSMMGILCLFGTVWVAVRFSSSRRAQALGVGVVAVYLWTLLSMAATAAGTTLLSFRLEAVLIVLLGSAGVFGFLEGSHAIYQAINEPPKFRIAAVVVATIGAMAFAQNIPQVLQSEITVAYSDTDGDGNRADMRPPSAVSYYREVDDALTEQTGRPRDETVLLTADTSFLSYYPYFGFQGLTSHYANPLAQFDQRADAIERWTEPRDPRPDDRGARHQPVARPRRLPVPPRCRRLHLETGGGRLPERSERAALHRHLPRVTVRGSTLHRDRYRPLRTGGAHCINAMRAGSRPRPQAEYVTAQAGYPRQAPAAPDEP